ncbi:MAG: histidine kinase [Clostridiaceae bacterium]|nr:histidine kinase [Clostridiaceae bacterium]
MKMIKKVCHRVRNMLSPSNDKRIKNALLTFIVFAILLITAGFFIYTQYLNYAIKEKICENIHIAIEQKKANLDYRFEQVSESGKTVWASLFNYVNSSSDRESELKEYREIVGLLTSFEGRHMIRSIKLYVPYDKSYSEQRDNIYPLHELEGTVYAQKSGTYWIGTHQIKRNVLEYIDVISCVMSISSKSDYKAVAGVLFLNISVSDILEMLNVEYENAHIYLCERNGKIVATDDSAKVGEFAFSSELMENISKTQSGYIDSEKDDILIFSKMETMDWYLVLSINRSELNSYSSFDLKMIKILYTIAIIVVFVLLLFVVYTLIINSTVSKINKSILDINPGSNYYNFSNKQTEMSKVRFPFGSLFSLDLSVRSMVSEIKSLIEEQYKAEIEAKEYQMQALQAQIKPHFLYNTLDTIIYLVKEKDIYNSVWMISNLSEYLRGSINRGLGYVTLYEELELVKVYISIMRKRFSNSFTVEYLVSDDSLKCYLPKLTLQPFIENALVHGLLYCEKEQKKLFVRADVTDDMLEIEIEDSGKGMSREVLEQLKQQNTDNKKNYGINNVCKRLKLFSRGQFSFSIHSIEDMGTCVTIRLPLIYELDRE